ncbi:DUF5776 domain-containing protein [Intestinibacter bartlettii]|uniref:DUF5776 domain-containing protein n=1 Tax=Intestinibacter bartlettii TaxID=261299 RepID=UPI0034A18C4A
MDMARCMNKRAFANFIMRKIIHNVKFHSSPDFGKTSVIGIAKAGKIFTIVDFVKRDGTDMYRLKSGVYITASKRYVVDFWA